MASLASSLFTRYNLSEEEQLAGQQLTISNIQVIQNHICTLAEEKTTLKFDVLNQMAYVQREAELQGQIAILQMLLEQASNIVLISDSTS